jgi:hypothetical protein
MKYLRVACLALMLIASVACAKKDKGQTPAAEPAKAEQAAPAAAPAPAPSSSSSLSATQLHTCNITNLTDNKCSDGLAKEFAALLLAQGESDKIAINAGQDFAKALSTVPADKRNGVRMKSPSTGNIYTFLIQNQGGKCYLQLVEMNDASDSFKLLGSNPVPACHCKK